MQNQLQCSSGFPSQQQKIVILTEKRYRWLFSHMSKVEIVTSRGSWLLAWLDPFIVSKKTATRWKKNRAIKSLDYTLFLSSFGQNRLKCFLSFQHLSFTVVMTLGRTSLIVKEDLPSLIWIVERGDKLNPFTLPRLPAGHGSQKRRYTSPWNACQFLVLLFSIHMVQMMNWNDLNMVSSQSNASIQAYNP